MQTESCDQRQVRRRRGPAENDRQSGYRRAASPSVPKAAHTGGRGGGGRAGRIQRLVATTPAERSLALLKLADRIERRGRRSQSWSRCNCGKPLVRVLDDEIPAIVDCFRFFAGAARCLPGSSRRVSAGAHQHDPARSGRRGGVDRALELSADDGRVEDRAGAGRRQLRRDQAVRANTADDAEARAALAEIFPPGVVNVVIGRGDSVGAALIDHAGVRMVSLTGGVGTGQKVFEAAVGDDQAHPSRARRQGAGHRLRRCRPDGGGGRYSHGRLLQCRPGLHGRLPHLRGRQDLRQISRRSERRRIQHQVRRAGG